MHHGKAVKHPRPRPKRKGNRVKDPVPVAPLRAKALELLGDDVTISDVAKRLGWMNGRHPDTSRLQRRLGLRPESKNSKTLKNGDRVTYGYTEPNVSISYARAVEICRAFGIDPVDIKDENGESLL